MFRSIGATFAGLLVAALVVGLVESLSHAIYPAPVGLNAGDKAANPVFLWVDREAGHGQGKPLAARIRDQVDQWSFLMWRTGLCDSYAQTK